VTDPDHRNRNPDPVSERLHAAQCVRNRCLTTCFETAGFG
jgi:hypothetical protein